MILLASALLFSGEVSVAAGRTRTLDIEPRREPSRLSSIYTPLGKGVRIRLVLLRKSEVIRATAYGDSGDLSVGLEPATAYRLVLENPAQDSGVAKVQLRVRVTPERGIEPDRRVWLAFGSVAVFLAVAAFAGVTLWRRILASPPP